MEFDSFLLFWSFDSYWSQHLCKLDCTHFLLIFLLCLGWGCCKGYRRLSRSTRGTHMSGKRGKQCCWKICWDSFCFVWLFLIQSEKVFLPFSVLLLLDEQFYLKTGTCKFGASCKFHHPKHSGGSMSHVPLNIYGYPLRPVRILLLIFLVELMFQVMLWNFDIFKLQCSLVFIISGWERMLLLFENGAVQIWYNL